MILRYVVEGNFGASFTASKKVKDEGEALKITISLGLLNLKEGYKKYSRAILYEDNNVKIRNINIYA